MKDIITDAKEVLKDVGMPLQMVQIILEKLAHHKELRESQTQLMVTYKMTFATWKVHSPFYRKVNLSK
jgi:hypothetical protein